MMYTIIYYEHVHFLAIRPILSDQVTYCRTQVNRYVAICSHLRTYIRMKQMINAYSHKHFPSAMENF